MGSTLLLITLLYIFLIKPVSQSNHSLKQQVAERQLTLNWLHDITNQLPADASISTSISALTLDQLMMEQGFDEVQWQGQQSVTFEFDQEQLGYALALLTLLHQQNASPQQVELRAQAGQRFFMRLAF